MLCRKFKYISVFHPINSSIIYRPLVQTRSFSKWYDILSGRNMSPSVRLKLIRELIISRVFNAWTRSYTVNSLFKRCRTERSVNKMFVYFRQVFFRPRTHLLVSATAAFKNTEEKPGPPKKCSRNIKDREMKRLIKDLERVEDLSKATLFCEGCDKRIIIDTKHKGVQYCDCPHARAPTGIYDGWVPYMEAEDVIIWRKEYKPGGLFAYKVYGRYKHLRADDFAKIQVDGAYRKVWDAAVASIDIVEQEANGLKDQAVIHWEVLWPRLFANRDYVYLRRHKEFNVQTRCLVHKDAIFPDKERCVPDKNYVEHGCNVHAASKDPGKKPAAPPEDLKDNKVYVIVSRSCRHPAAPESTKVVRVMEYWSHMVITTLNGPDRPGMEFVLTYYDEPAVGGLPTAVTSWAMGRAGPAFLERMRSAARDYTAWRGQHQHLTPDFTPFEVTNVSYEHLDDDEEDAEAILECSELDKESINVSGKTDESTQTKPVIITPIDDEPQDGPKAEVENKFQLKHASKDHPIPTNEIVDAATEGEKGTEDDPLKYNLTLSTTIPQDQSEQEQRTNEGANNFNFKISIRLPMTDSDNVTNSDITDPPLEDGDKTIEDAFEKDSLQSPNIFVKVDNPLNKEDSIKKLVNDPAKTISESSVKVVDDKVVDDNVDASVKKITANVLTKTNEPADVKGMEDRESEEGERESVSEEASWWRYLYPLYYFV